MMKTRHGFLGKRLVLNQDEKGYRADNPKKILSPGDRGVVLTKLRPAGKADFEGKTFDVVSQGEFIEPGTGIEVIEKTGSRVVVRRSSRNG